MTPQEMFDKVAIHILTQGERCGTPQGCKYRWHGRRCAAGCLITDDAYDPLMEGARVSCIDSDDERRRAVLLSRALVASGVDKPLWPFLSKLQDVHDQLPVEDWPSALSSRAKEFDVSDRVVTEWVRQNR